MHEKIADIQNSFWKAYKDCNYSEPLIENDIWVSI